MGRFPNIAAAKEKTGAAKAKLYSMYGKEIYQEARNGGSDPDGNLSLRRLIEKARRDQVPSDVIKRALDKVNSGIDESYVSATYELFGPGGSTLIIECLTDNLNRSVSSIRTVLNKCKIKMGSQGSVSYNYDHLGVVGFKGFDEEDILNVLILNDIDMDDFEVENGITYVYGKPSDLFRIKEAILTLNKNLEFEMDEISYFPKETIKLSDEDLTIFNKTMDLLEEIEDVQHIYHNVEL